MRVDEILSLSPRQIRELYLAPPEEAQEAQPADPKARYAQLLEMIRGGLVKVTPEQLERLKALHDG